MQERQKYENKIWRLAGQILFIFGFPAIIAGIASKHFEKNGKVLILGSAFVLSWIIFIIKYRKIIK